MAKTSPVATVGPRSYFTPQESVIEWPDLIDHQVKSFHAFVKDGLTAIFEEINPIEDNTGT